jgi:hypothetical protein
MFGKLVRMLHLECSHEFVVLVLQEMAVVDITGILDELVLRNWEVGVATFTVEEVVSRGESDSHHHYGAISDQSDLLPTPVLLRYQLVADRTAYIFILIDTVRITVVSQFISFGFDQLKHIKTCHRSIVSIGSVFRKSLVENLLSGLV